MALLDSSKADRENDVIRWKAAALTLLMKDYDGFSEESFQKEFPAVNR